MEDVVVIGAGLAGITCAKHLQEQGQRVVLLEKSRGVGGRIATRRLQGSIADHGAKYLEKQGSYSSELVEQLLAQEIIRPWIPASYELMNIDQSLDKTANPSPCWQLLSPPARYVAPLGMSAIAKNLARDLEIRFNHRVEKIIPTDQGWSICFDNLDPHLATPISPLETKALVLAIPAPQALALLSPLGSLDQNPLDPIYLAQLAGAEYEACITVMAGYAPELEQTLEMSKPAWQIATFPQDPILAWVGIDSTKRGQPPQPLVVLHSTPTFAAQHLENTDLNSLGLELLDRSSTHLLPELNSPLWFQVHRWRYAQPQTFLPVSCFPAPTVFPLVCCGDWCQDNSLDNLANNLTNNLPGNFIENALASGLAAAQYLKSTSFNQSEEP